MPHILKNEQLEIHIDLPHENYQTSRFDWTGKIQTVKFRGIPVSITEKNNGSEENSFGKGFYNEFGIDTALGFDCAKVGEWFHKIGIGLLKKNDSEYFFHKEHEIQPAEFEVKTTSKCIELKCRSELLHGYGYILTKKMEVQDDGFIISYHLKNTGEKEIITDEYVHNFVAINNEKVSPEYLLKFPFQLKPEKFLDSEKALELRCDEVSFKSNPEGEFFIYKLSGNTTPQAEWELIHRKQKIGISETASFQAQKVNLWGWKHVISPELFHHIHLKPDESTEWYRRYKIFMLD